ncbi:MAG: potassium channel family protein [Caulobacteraceae bacterium]
MKGLADSPLRNLGWVVAFVVAVVIASTLAYMHAGWSFADAVYMVLLTVYTVGYGEVRPIDTPYLHGVTIATMVLGCTGMILVTGALVQVLTVFQIKQILGGDRMKNEIDKLKGHVIVCGFGRIGVMLAKDLEAGGAPFLILERNEKRLAEAEALGYLAMHGDATDEAALQAAGIDKARVLATVLPDDAANVFITLSARSLNPSLHIIARGEAPSTESKLLHAGADKVVLPTHIGAERIAEMILFPDASRFIRGSQHMRDVEKSLRDMGLDLTVAAVHERSEAVGLTVAELEARARGAFFVVRIDQRDGASISQPPADTRIGAGDGLVLVGRGGGKLYSILTTPAKTQSGRTVFRS